MPVSLVQGDLLLAAEPIIGHQVNCQAVMGSGVALQIKRTFPEVYAEYRRFCGKHPDPGQLLGSCQLVRTASAGGTYVANLFGQLDFGRDGRKYTDDDALSKAFGQLYTFAQTRELAVALPYKIGCDRGGSDWETVLGMLQATFTDVHVVLYQWTQANERGGIL